MKKVLLTKTKNNDIFFKNSKEGKSNNISVPPKKAYL